MPPNILFNQMLYTGSLSGLIIINSNFKIRKYRGMLDNSCKPVPNSVEIVDNFNGEDKVRFFDVF